MSSAVPQISIAIHMGLYDRWPLLQNLLKSFLVANSYPNIELLLIESGEDASIRKWLEDLDFDTYFTNFSGETSDIIKNPSVKIKKNLIFINSPAHENWPMNSYYQMAMFRAKESFSGEYLIIMAEDYQFIVSGNLWEDYLDIMDHSVKGYSLVLAQSQGASKLCKKNNKHKGPFFSKKKSVPFFVLNSPKFDHTSLISRRLLDEASSLLPPEEDILHKCHGFIQSHTDACKTIGVTRIYPLVPSVLWMANGWVSKAASLIQKETAVNPNYLLYNIVDKSVIQREALSLSDKFPSAPIFTEVLARSLANNHKIF